MDANTQLEHEMNAHDTPAQQFQDMLMDAVDWDLIDELDEAIATQFGINSGMVWGFQGSAGRHAMGLIEAGHCMVGLEPRTDYYGNTVPARYMLEEGDKGTESYVRTHKGQAWLDALLHAEEETE